MSAAVLAAEIDAFALVVDELRAIATRSDAGRRNDLVVLRRRLSEQVAQLRTAGMQTFADPLIANDFRSRLSEVLKLMALHQAKWPAVSINEDDVAYRHSAQQLADANRAFIAWTRAALARLR